MSANTEAKAHAYLAEGKVDVMKVDREKGTATVAVTGSKTYIVTHNGFWVCSCPARIEHCAHVIAAGLVVHVKPLASTPRVLATPDSIEAFLAGMELQ